jgi:hypothetical protein
VPSSADIVVDPDHQKAAFGPLFSFWAHAPQKRVGTQKLPEMGVSAPRWRFCPSVSKAECVRKHKSLRVVE